jgi:hypothetical protein
MLNKSTKAVLLSALVFPGAGHLYLRRYARGLLLAAIAGLAVYFIVSVAMQTAFDVVAQIEGGSVPLDTQSISELVSQESRNTEPMTNVATFAFLGVWVIGMVDAWRLGHAEDVRDDQSELRGE